MTSLYATDLGIRSWKTSCWFLLTIFLHCAAIAEPNPESTTESSIESGNTFEPMYVSDQLKIAMRAGDSYQYKILRYLVSGTKLKVLSISEDGDWYKVVHKGKKGWVETKDLSATPSAKEQLLSSKAKLSRLSSAHEEKTNSNEALKATIETLNEQLATLKKEHETLSTTYQHLKEVSGNALTLNQENKDLHESIGNLESQLEELRTVNTIIKNDRFNEGIYRGILATAAGVIIALLCQRISRRERRSAWD